MFDPVYIINKIKHQEAILSLSPLHAGAAVRDITPLKPMFLFGYPHVERTSTGTNDPLLASVLVLERGGEQTCVFIAVDLIFVHKATTRSVRSRISKATGIAESAILLSATHTHSGPGTLNYLSNEADPVVPPVDTAYLRYAEDQIVAAAIDAWNRRRPAKVAQTIADATGIGTCRHNPAGPSDLDVPVLAVRDAESSEFIAILMVCTMHPTVLHEDFTLFSGDFPAYARTYLQRQVAGAGCPIVYHMGASGNQSPRHVTRSNTLSEAERLGNILGRAVERSLQDATYITDVTLAASQRLIEELPVRQPPSVPEAERQLTFARTRMNALRGPGTPATALRTAECDLFGAEETLALAIAAEQGRLRPAVDSCLPAEVQLLRVGDRMFAGWPGEFFVEFALRLKARSPNTAVITAANGDLQGYVVTQEAVDHNWYEAGNALLKSPDTGDIILAATLELIDSAIAEVARV